MSFAVDNSSNETDKLSSILHELQAVYYILNSYSCECSVHLSFRKYFNVRVVGLQP